VAIVAVVALVIVAVIIAIAAVAGGSDSSSDGGTTTTSAAAATTTTSEDASGLSDSTRQAFVDSCVAGGATEVQCTCIVDELAQTLDDEELQTLEGELNGTPPPEIADAVAACV
jgi:hypothetical protein